MMRYRKRPIVIDAWQWTFDGTTTPREPAWITDALCGWPDSGIAFWPDHDDGPRIEIKTLEGVMVALPGAWIIKGIKGELYPCEPDIFEATYDKVYAGKDAEIERDQDMAEAAMERRSAGVRKETMPPWAHKKWAALLDELREVLNKHPIVPGRSIRSWPIEHNWSDPIWPQVEFVREDQEYTATFTGFNSVEVAETFPPQHSLFYNICHTEDAEAIVEDAPTGENSEK